MTEKTTKKTDEKHILPLGKMNFITIAAGFLLVIIGFILMYVGPEGRGDADVIYSFSKTSLPVLFCMIGFVVVGFGIMKRFKKAE